MPPQQTCCCKDGEDPCPNCYAGAAFGCSSPCCWCTGIIGKCEGEAEYGAALLQCHQDWLALGWEQSPCPDEFEVTVAVPDNLKTTYKRPDLIYDPDLQGYFPEPMPNYWEEVYTDIVGDGGLDGHVYIVESNDARWITNKIASFVETGTGYSPATLPDASHVGKSCPANATSTCQSSNPDSCISNAGSCCQTCFEQGVDDCDQFSGFNFGLYGKQSHYNMQTTALWYKTAQSTTFTVGVDSRGNRPCKYTGLSGVVGTGTIVYLGLRNKVTGGYDTNCPGYPCDCQEEECESCIHCIAPNCFVCKDKYCQNENPYIGWDSALNHCVFDVYQVPVSWKVRYDLSAEKFNSQLTDEKYHWVQQVYLEPEEDWSGITVNPATQSLVLADAIPTKQFNVYDDFSTDCGNCPRDSEGNLPSCVPGDDDYPCECPLCLRWTSNTIQLAVGREEKRDPSDLSRCAFIFNGGGEDFNYDICPEVIPQCDGNVSGAKRYERFPSIWKTNPAEFEVSGTATYTYGPGAECSEEISVGTKVYHNTGWDFLNGQIRVATKTGPRTQNCDQACARCDFNGGSVDCSWEYNGFVISITGLGD